MKSELHLKEHTVKKECHDLIWLSYKLSFHIRGSKVWLLFIESLGDITYLPFRAPKGSLDFKAERFKETSKRFSDIGDKTAGTGDASLRASASSCRSGDASLGVKRAFPSAGWASRGAGFSLFGITFYARTTLGRPQPPLNASWIAIPLGWDYPQTWICASSMSIALTAKATSISTATPHPTALTKWKYRGIYRVEESQVGLGSPEVSITVGG